MRYIAIREEPNGSLYVDKYFFDHYTDSDLSIYNYTKVEIPEECFDDLSVEDFDEKMKFSEKKYTERTQREKTFAELPKLQSRLIELSQDLVQAQCGAVFEDLEDRIKEFQTIHNEIRKIQGKEPRIYQ